MEPYSFEISAGATLYLYGVVFWILYILITKKDVLGLDETKSKYEVMYTGIKYWRDDLCVYYWPIFLLRRILFATIPALLCTQPSLQLQLLCFMTTLYIKTIVSIRPQILSVDRRLETFNEIMIMFTCYHMFCFTYFVLDDHQQYLMGYSMIGVLGGTVLWNIILMIMKNIDVYKQKLRLQARREYFRVHMHEILRKEHVERIYERKINSGVLSD